jgi:hypothetical protein
MYPEHLFDRTLWCGVSRKPTGVYVDVSATSDPSYDEPLRCRAGGASSLSYCVIRVSGPGVYGECADR